MKRIYYVSRFSKALQPKELKAIQTASLRNNPPKRITGFLVCLGDTFFQVLEGPKKAVDHLFFDKIMHDPRHHDVLCLKSEPDAGKRMFPDWHMKIFDLNMQGDTLPFAFRQMLTALLESHYVIAQYTQPTVFRMLAKGVNPTSLLPQRKKATVFFSDIIGFSLFSQWLAPQELIELVNSHVGMCSQVASQYGGEVNKILGDGILAYFSQKQSDAAIEASLELLEEMARRRQRTRSSNPLHHLYGGIGLAYGIVYEGNIGDSLKRDFTILGNTVNLASRLESYTRELEAGLILNKACVANAKRSWGFNSLGKHRLKGQSRAEEIFSIDGHGRLNVPEIYRGIQSKFGK